MPQGAGAEIGRARVVGDDSKLCCRTRPDTNHPRSVQYMQARPKTNCLKIALGPESQ